MAIYVVVKSWQNDYTDVIGVFSTFQKAQNAVNRDIDIENFNSKDIPDMIHLTDQEKEIGRIGPSVRLRDYLSYKIKEMMVDRWNQSYLESLMEKVTETKERLLTENQN